MPESIHLSCLKVSSASGNFVMPYDLTSLCDTLDVTLKGKRFTSLLLLFSSCSKRHGLVSRSFWCLVQC
jgi:hypothetical protein